ncbi:MAG: NAD(+) synthase [Clostridia bacterium]|nr:NAD(+) synthase [Clostridia bacterium]
MKHGLIRVAAITPAAKVADLTYNCEAIVSAAKKAAEDGARILTLPELSLTGACLGDLYFSEALTAAVERVLARYMEETASLSLLSVIGLPARIEGRLYNAAAVVYGGKLLGLVPRCRIPRADLRAQDRLFSEGKKGVRTVSYAGQQTAFGASLLFVCDTLPSLRIAVCMDDPARYEGSATLLCVPTAEPAGAGSTALRRTRLSAAAPARILLSANAGAGESGTDLVFASHSLLAFGGRILTETAPFSDGVLLCREVDTALAEQRLAETRGDCAEEVAVSFSLPMEKTRITHPPRRLSFLPEGEAAQKERFSEILEIQARGLAARFTRAYAKSGVIGVSGGLDSTLALLIAVRAADLCGMKREQIVAVTMPGFGTTARTKGNAEKLCESLGVSLRCIDITAAVRVHFKDIGHPEDCFDVVYENAQARERTQILMDIANAEGGLVIGTGDLSELALGFATYNGDHMSMYAPNAAVPKTLMRYLVSHLADAAEAEGRGEEAAILRDVLATPVSPELLPPKDGEIAQCTENIVGPYELHDYFLYHLVRNRFSPDKILRLALESFKGIYDKETVKGWLKLFLRRFFSQQFKRSCLPDGPRIGSVTLSPRGGFVMPSDANVAVWLSALDNE